MYLYIIIWVYLLLGVVLVPFLVKKTNCKDEDAPGTGWKVKWVFVPGFILLWPFLFYNGSMAKDESLPQPQIRAHLIYWSMVSVFLPVWISLALYYRPIVPLGLKQSVRTDGTVVLSKANQEYTVRLIKSDTSYLLEVQSLKNTTSPDQSVYITMEHQKQYLGKLVGKHQALFVISKFNDVTEATITIHDQITKETISIINL